MNLLFRVNKNHGIWLKNLSLPFLPFLFAAHPGLQPAVLACLAESTSLLLKAMNLKRQHVVGTTLGGSHTQTHTHANAHIPLNETMFFFSKNCRSLPREAIITVGVRIQQRSKAQTTTKSISLAKFTHLTTAHSHWSPCHLLVTWWSCTLTATTMSFHHVLQNLWCHTS